MPPPIFITLPAEIRLHIYTYLLGAPHIFLGLFYGACGRDHVHYPLHPLFTSILRVNRLLSSEAYPVLYGENTFHFLSDMSVRSYILSKRCMSLLRHASIGPMQIGGYEASVEMARSVRHLKRECPRLKTLGVQFWIVQYTNQHLIEALNDLVDAVGQVCGDMDVERVIIGCNNDVSEMELSILDLKGLRGHQVKRDTVVDWMKHTLAVMGRVGQIKLLGHCIRDKSSSWGMLVRAEERVLIDRRLRNEWGKKLPPPKRWLSGHYAR